MMPTKRDNITTCTYSAALAGRLGPRGRIFHSHHDDFTVLLKCKRSTAISNGIEPRQIRHMNTIGLVERKRLCSNGLFQALIRPTILNFCGRSLAL